MLLNRFDGTLLGMLRREKKLSYFDLAIEAKGQGITLKPWTIERHEKGTTQPFGSAVAFYCLFFNLSFTCFYTPTAKQATEVANAKKKTKAKNKTRGARGSKNKRL